MSELDHTQQTLIRLLAGGDWTSGAALGEALGLSREAVAQRVRRLAGFGLQIESLSGRGHRLAAPLELLDAGRIAAGLDRKMTVTVLASTDSTNRHVAEQPHSPALCLAEHQSAGRGRRGRHWQSPFGQNLYLSLRWELPRWPERLPALSLVLGIALAETLRRLDIPAQVKWPNDLYLNGRKFGGLLIEQRGEAQGPCVLVIGLGLNVQMREQPDIDRAWTSLAREEIAASRNDLAIALANTLAAELAALDNERVTRTLKRFDTLDVYRDQIVCVEDGGQSVCGRSRGLDDWGRLQLQTETGLRSFSVGDISLRAAP